MLLFGISPIRSGRSGRIKFKRVLQYPRIGGYLNKVVFWCISSTSSDSVQDTGLHSYSIIFKRYHNVVICIPENTVETV